MKIHAKYPFTVIMMIILIVGMPITIGYLYMEGHKAKEVSAPVIAEVTPTVTPESSQISEEVTPSPSEAPVTPSPAESHSFVTVSDEYFNDAMFIGDSRTVGLSEYAPFEGATYFANVGMSAHNIMSATVSIPSLGKVGLKELLKSKAFGKVYIMLGINEVGYKLDSVVSKYSDILDMVKELQPDAIIYVEANLHVTKEKSDNDSVINNPAINSLNERLKEFANEKTIFYIDINEAFDDESGSLISSYTSDNVHILAKYYAQWRQWITTKAIQK